MGVEALFGELSGDGTEFWAPVTAWAPPTGSMECGWYASAL